MCSKCLTKADTNKANAEAIATLAGAAFTLDSIHAHPQKDLVLTQIDLLLGGNVKVADEVGSTSVNGTPAQEEAAAEPKIADRPWSIEDGVLYLNGTPVGRVVAVGGVPV